MDSMFSPSVQSVLRDYPRIFFACHTRHVRDPRTRKLLSAHQASILDHLDRVEPTGLLALAGHMGVTASTMSLAVDRLVSRRYVIRSRDRRDARRVNLRVSAAGERIKSAQSVLDPERVNAMLHWLNPRELERALDGLELLARAARQEMASRSSAPERTTVSQEN